MDEKLTPHGDPLLEVGATYVSDQETPVNCGYGPRLPTHDPGYLPRLHPFTVIDPMVRLPDDWYAVRATVEGYEGEYLLSFALNEQAAVNRFGGTTPWVSKVNLNNGNGLQSAEKRGTVNDMSADTITVADQTERDVALAALAKYRGEKAEADARKAELLAVASSWRNILAPHDLVSINETLEAAGYLGYPLIEWNGWIYSADSSVNEEDRICKAEDVPGGTN